MRLLKKQPFSSIQETTKYFDSFKVVMCTTHVSYILDFKITFIMDYDSSRNGIGVVLMQEGRPLVFESFQLEGKKSLKPNFEKEMLSMLHAIKK